MKKVLLSAGALALSLSASAQTYFSEDFSSGSLGQFTSIDNDGDTYEWDVADVTGNINTTNSSAISNSWSSSAGVLTPDNILVTTNAVDLSAASGTVLLEWVAGSLETTNNWWEEYYDVIVTTGNTVVDITGATPVFGEVLPSGGTMHARSVDVSAFIGQTVYVSFRHHNCTDGNFLVLDDIVVRTPLAWDIEMVSLNIASTVGAGNVNIAGTVKNNGANQITSFDLSYDAGSGPVTETVTATINSGATYSFTHSTPLNATTAGSPYNIDVCATVASDGDTGNDCLAHNLGVVSSVVDKYVLVEEKTGTWCQYCPYGSASMENVSAIEPKMIGIAIHNQDPMAVSSYDSGSQSFPDFSGYPYAASDRMVGDHAYYIQDLFDAREMEVPPASISFTTAEEAGGTITITPSVDMVTTLSGDYRLGVALVEDDVTGTGSSWMQVNGLSGGTSAVMQGSIDWTQLGSSVDVSTVFGGYDHVGRALGNNQINGDAGSLPGTLNDGSSYEYTYTFNYNSAWNLSKMHAVAFLVNNTTGEVLNAGETAIQVSGLNEDGFNFEATLAPNPTNGVSKMTLKLDNTSEVALEVVDVLGNKVVMLNQAQLTAGDYQYNIDLSNESAGMYFVNVSVNGVVKTTKLQLTK